MYNKQYKFFMKRPLFDGIIENKKFKKNTDEIENKLLQLIKKYNSDFTQASYEKLKQYIRSLDKTDFNNLNQIKLLEQIRIGDYKLYKLFLDLLPVETIAEKFQIDIIRELDELIKKKQNSKVKIFLQRFPFLINKNTALSCLFYRNDEILTLLITKGIYLIKEELDREQKLLYLNYLLRNDEELYKYLTTLIENQNDEVFSEFINVFPLEFIISLLKICCKNRNLTYLIYIIRDNIYIRETHFLNINLYNEPELNLTFEEYMFCRMAKDFFIIMKIIQGEINTTNLSQFLKEIKDSAEFKQSQGLDIYAIYLEELISFEENYLLTFAMDLNSIINAVILTDFGADVSVLSKDNQHIIELYKKERADKIRRTIIISEKNMKLEKKGKPTIKLYYTQIPTKEEIKELDDINKKLMDERLLPIDYNNLIEEENYDNTCEICYYDLPDRETICCGPHKAHSACLESSNNKCPWSRHPLITNIINQQAGMAYYYKKYYKFVNPYF